VVPGRVSCGGVDETRIMPLDDLSRWTHDHVFDPGNRAGERGTRAVMWLTAATMVVEIVAGWVYNSMALLADGWHMSSHAVAIGLSAFAYAAARRHAGDPRFAFGTWKIEILGGFASAVFLLVVVVMMVLGSVERLIDPQPIRYPEAMAIAAVGLAVNLASAGILGRAHDAHHGHDGHHHHHHHHHDLNLKSAYLHVLADALTSVLAIVALGGGWLYGWDWLDPVMGIAGAVLVAVWARGLLRTPARSCWIGRWTTPWWTRSARQSRRVRAAGTAASPTCTSGASASGPTLAPSVSSRAIPP